MIKKEKLIILGESYLVSSRKARQNNFLLKYTDSLFLQIIELTNIC